MLLKRQFHVWIVSVSLLVSSCSTAYYLQHHPDLTEDIFYKRVIKSEQDLPSGDEFDHLKAVELRTQYTYAFLVEKADRVIEENYSSGKALYGEALLSFEQAIENGKIALYLRHPELGSETDLNFSVIDLTPDDIPFLYWLGAAYGGAISSSRGKSLWIIQLPKVGHLLESALAIDPSWNYGAIHSAMISYSMARADLDGRNVDEAKRHFKAAMRFSGRNDLGAIVSYAENICIYEQDREKFKQLLDRVMLMDAQKNKDLSLGNIIAQDRARWLLSREEELFY